MIDFLIDQNFSLYGGRGGGCSVIFNFVQNLVNIIRLGK